MDGATGSDLRKFSDWLKRMYILEGSGKHNMLELMQKYATMNIGRVSKRIVDILDGGITLLYDELINDEYLKLRQKDIAALLNITPSSLSKIKSKNTNNGRESDTVCS
jgi:hypothetical protein